MTTFDLDPSVRRSGEGRVLVGGSPLTLLRLTAAGADLIDTIVTGEAPAHATTAAALVDRLLDAGIVHPRPGVGPSPTEVTVVIPAYATSADILGPIVAACAGVASVVIVDDASPHPVGAIAGASIVRRDANGGPGQARTTGLDHVATPYVAFIDADVEVGPGWLDGLLGHFEDDRVALVAPRVASRSGASLLARYDSVRSPLDLGAVAARVRAGTRVSYVPAAAMVCRVEALRSVGGFDQGLRVGEDVDLVWRLDEAGWRVRYEPRSVVHHAPRPTLRAWIEQRFGYGTSGGPLAARHPGALAPVRINRWSAASWAAIVGGWPIVGTAIGAVTTGLLARRLRAVPEGGRLALRLAGLGHLHAGRSLASGVTRAWWPIAVMAALVSKRCRRALLIAAIVPAVHDWRTDRPPLDPVSYVALHWLDDASYGAGLAVGAVRARSIEALLPELT